MAARSRVFLTTASDGGIAKAIARLVDKLGLPATAETVGVKLNLCDYRRWETGVTTDPAVLDPLLALLRRRYPSARIYLFEHDATGTVASTLFRFLGIDEVARKHDAECLSLADLEWESVRVKGAHFDSVDVPKLLRSTDLLINHPKLKTHGRTKITCSLKNTFGCYRVKQKSSLHHVLDEAIADINLAIRFDFTIVDANLCVEGNRGPSQGYPKRLGFFIGGTDPVAIDTFGARLMGFQPLLVGHIRRSWMVGVGSMSYDLDSELERNEMAGCRFEFSRPKYFLMETLRRLVK